MTGAVASHGRVGQSPDMECRPRLGGRSARRPRRAAAVLAAEALLARDVLAKARPGGRLGHRTGAPLGTVGNALAQTSDRSAAEGQRDGTAALSGGR